jgi:hypothetical protein
MRRVARASGDDPELVRQLVQPFDAVREDVHEVLDHDRAPASVV